MKNSDDGPPSDGDEFAGVPTSPGARLFPGSGHADASPTRGLAPSKRTAKRGIRPRTEERLRATERVLAEGHPSRVAVDILAKQFNVSEYAVRSWISQVYARWTAQAEADRPHRHAEAREMLRHAYRTAADAGDHGPAVQALDRLCRLEGVYAPPETKLQINTAVALGVDNPDSIRGRIRELLNRPEVAALVKSALGAPPRPDDGSD